MRAYEFSAKVTAEGGLELPEGTITARDWAQVRAKVQELWAAI